MSWNVDQSSNRDGRIDEQLHEIESHDVDLLLLQEVRYGGDNEWLEKWREGLESIGLGEIEHTCDWAAELAESTVPPHSDIGHNNGHITAVSTDWELERRDHTIREYAQEHDWTHFGTHFPEKILVTELTAGGEEIDVWNVRAVPGNSYGEEKIKLFETVYNRLETEGERSRLLAGDFNAPKAELPDGQMISFGYDKEASLQDRWVAAERSILRGLGRLGMIDAFRSLHGFGELDVADSSWNGKRFDHLFASEDLPPTDCYYDQSVECSDHAPLLASINV